MLNSLSFLIMPIILILVLNILLYLFYVAFFSLSFSFLFPMIRKMLGMGVLLPAENMNFYSGVQIFIFLAVLVISVLFYRYFYITSKIMLVRDNYEKEENSFKLMLSLANLFLAGVYISLPFIIAKFVFLFVSPLYIGNPLFSNAVLFIISGAIFIVSIICKKFAYFTFAKPDEYIEEGVVEEVKMRPDYGDDELHIKIK